MPKPQLEIDCCIIYGKSAYIYVLVSRVQGIGMQSAKTSNVSWHESKPEDLLRFVLWLYVHFYLPAYSLISTPHSIWFDSQWQTFLLWWTAWYLDSGSPPTYRHVHTAVSYSMAPSPLSILCTVRIRVLRSPPMQVMYLVVEILIDTSSLQLSYSCVSDRQPSVVVRYRYDFYFIIPVGYTLATWTLVRISIWASTRPAFLCLASLSLTNSFQLATPVLLVMVSGNTTWSLKCYHP